MKLITNNKLFLITFLILLFYINLVTPIFQPNKLSNTKIFTKFNTFNDMSYLYLICQFIIIFLIFMFVVSILNYYRCDMKYTNKDSLPISKEFSLANDNSKCHCFIKNEERTLLK